MPIPKSQIVILIDINCCGGEDWCTKVTENIKEAISLQVSRGAFTSYKLLKLGREPLLARVKWAYSFVDSGSSSFCTVNKAGNWMERPLESLTYEGWDLFTKELDEIVNESQLKKSERYGSTSGGVSVIKRVGNLMEMLELVKMTSFAKPRKSLDEEGHFRKQLENLSVFQECFESEMLSRDKLIFVFTSVPKTFSALVHLAYGLTKFKKMNSPENIQICLVDVQNVAAAEGGDNDRLAMSPKYCFWNELVPENEPIAFNLKVLCLRKIAMIHKLEELRYPWKYEDSMRLPFGHGMGMRRLQRWKPPLAQRVQGNLEQEIGYCFPLRRCFSNEQ